MRLRSLYTLTLILFNGFVLSPALWAQDHERPTLVALQLNPEEKITVDGELSEPAWQRAKPATNFIQQDPINGAPATEQTEVRVIFDKDYLFIGVECFDSEPKRLLARQLVRDGFLASDDKLAWVLDPFDSQRTGYYFEVNPAGAMGDALLAPAQGGRFGASQNRAWDGIWLAKTRIHDTGWTVEVQIPFKTLNFDPHASAWGANFQRSIRRKNEETFWTAYGRTEGILHLASEGHIVGITNASQGVGLDVKPYVVSSYSDAPANDVSSVYKGTGGLDLFYNLTPQLKANFTVNTDFAQTDVDDRQVNLTRFPLFFPEKRDFFLESAGNFDFSREPNSNITPFFSRRIGLDENGQPQKINYGTKLSGRIGAYDLGLLQVQTAPSRGLSGENFTVFRPKVRLLSQSFAGMIYTRRAARDSSVPDRQTIGADFELATNRFRGSKNVQLSGFYSKTYNALKNGDNNAYGLRFNYPNDLWTVRSVYRTVDPNYDPAVGFVQRSGYHSASQFIQFGPRPKGNSYIRQVQMSFWAQTYMDMNFDITEQELRFTPIELIMQSGDTMQFRIMRWRERLDKDFEISDGIILPKGGEYRYKRYEFTFSTARQRRASLNSTIRVGSFYSGHRRDFENTLFLRMRRGLTAQLVAQFNRVELAEGNFSTKLFRAVVGTQFNPWISITNNIQYDSVSRVLGWQSRFRWIVRPGNDIYFVVMNDWIDNGQGLSSLDRNVTAKISYTYRF